MGKASWIWPEAEIADNIFFLFVHDVEFANIAEDAELRIAADSRYRIFVNGQFLAHGPHPTGPGEMSLDSFSIMGNLRGGKNRLAIQVQWIGEATASHDPKRPGLFCEIRNGDMLIGTDASWRCRRLHEYRQDLPRKNFALAYPEYLDLRNSQDLTVCEGDADLLPVAVIDPSLFGEMRERPIPPLLFEWHQCHRLYGVWKIGNAAPEEEDDATASLTQYLDYEPLESIQTSWSEDDPELVFDGGSGVSICLDLGLEKTGFPFIEIESESDGLIHNATAEILLTPDADTFMEHEPGPTALPADQSAVRPWLCRRHLRSACQIRVSRGNTRWIAWDYTGCRYVYFAFREFRGRVKIRRAGILSRHAALGKMPPTPVCGDKLLERIWQLGLRTAMLCAQELLIDCPTREQAQYWGDVLIVARILKQYFGDLSYYRETVRQAFQSINSRGLISCRYPANREHQVLYDYCLIPYLMMRNYLSFGGNPEAISVSIAPAFAQLDKFRSLIGQTGLIELNGKLNYEKGVNCLFIDHPGLGWHDFPHPGMERDGISAGLNFFYIMALTAFAEVLVKLGEDSKAADLLAEAAEIRRVAKKFFWQDELKRFADVRHETKGLIGFSQQVNTLAVLAGAVPDNETNAVFAQILNEDDPELCRCSPYFYYFMFEAMLMHDRRTEMIEIIRRRWAPMVNAGASSAWESFCGGPKDSLCHAWSAAPTIFL